MGEDEFHERRGVPASCAGEQRTGGGRSVALRLTARRDGSDPPSTPQADGPTVASQRFMTPAIAAAVTRAGCRSALSAPSLVTLRRAWDSDPREPCGCTRFRIRLLRPLGQLSAANGAGTA